MVTLLFLLSILLLGLCLIIFLGWKFVRHVWPGLNRIQTAGIIMAAILIGIAAVMFAIVYELFVILTHIPHG